MSITLLSSVRQLVESKTLPAYRVAQFSKAFYQDLIGSFEELTTWPKVLREELAHTVAFSRLREKQVQTSASGDVTKVLFEREDGSCIESVLMRYADGRNSVCVSCMVGCPVGCTFCATGKLGFHGMLSADEIVDQVLYFARLIKPFDAHITNVVYMGMGEPMLNLPEVEESLSLLNNAETFGLGIRHITVSTSGYVPQLHGFIERGFRGRLAVSLHAPNQELRAKLMPIAKVFSLDELFRVLDDYVCRTNKRVSYEYALMNDVNDTLSCAQELADLLGRRLAHVNLIPYNAVVGTPYARSTQEHIAQFVRILEERGIPYTLRLTMGDDIDAACGQLAAKRTTSKK